jgi:hypothetical protein
MFLNQGYNEMKIQFGKHIKTLILVILMGLLIACSSEKPAMNEKEPKNYTVIKLDTPITIDGDWDKEPWQSADTIRLGHYMGEKPEHIPEVEAKMAYDDENIYVIFRVADNYIKAVATAHQDPVCRDSCVEFFFTPGLDITEGYMNIETNCCGKMLFNFQQQRGVGIVPVAAEDLAKIEIAHSLPYETIVQEIQTPTLWTIEYRIPISVIESYMPVQKPAEGVQWKGNFYKCADRTSMPHWLSWSFVDRPAPDFHRPEYFGILTFGDTGK